MGMTFDLHGCLRDAASIPELCDELADYAHTLGWSYEIILRGALTGIILRPHPVADAMPLLFDSNGWLRGPRQQGPFESNEFTIDDIITADMHDAPEPIPEILHRLLLYIVEKYFADPEAADDDSPVPSPDHPGACSDTGETAYGARSSSSGTARDSLDSSSGNSPHRIAEPATMEYASSELLDRINGPRPPYDVDERSMWDMQRWEEFWQRWDEHRAPSLASLNARPLTMESVRLALEEQENEVKRREEDYFVLMTSATAKLSAIEEELMQESTSEELEESVRQSAELIETDLKGLVERNTSDTPAAYQHTMDWILRFMDASRQSQAHPLIQYIAGCITTAAVGIRMAFMYRQEWDMFLAVPSRLMVCATRFGQVAQLIRLFPDGRFENFALEAESIASDFATWSSEDA